MNTGKSHGWGMYALWFAEEFPGARILILRKVRADLIETTLIKPWEASIIDLHLKRGDITIQGGEQRKKYVHRNGSVFVPGGLDKSSRLMGGQWDLVIFVEATEATEDDYEDLLTRTSREAGVAPYSFIILDTNPGSANHWINQKANAGHIKRLLSRHEDNPNLFDVAEYDENGVAVRFTPTEQGRKYLAKLDSLGPGFRRDRLRDHLWAAASRLVWPEFGPQHYRSREQTLSWARFSTIVAGFDWGMTDPAALEVFGIEKRTRQAMRLFECYRRGKGLQWWARKFIEIDDICRMEFGRGVDECVYSHERPEQVQLINDLLVRNGKRGFVEQYRTPKEARRIETVRWFLDPSAAPQVGPEPDHSAPMVFFLSGSAIWPPEDEEELGLAPKSFAEEQPGYVWEPIPDKTRAKERPDPKVPNHACDAVGMALEGVFERIRLNLTPDLPEVHLDPSMEEEMQLLGLLPKPRRKKRTGV